MRRLRALVLLSLLGVVAAGYEITAWGREEAILIRAFHATGATLQEVHITSWTVIDSSRWPGGNLGLGADTVGLMSGTARHTAAALGWDPGQFRPSGDDGPEGIDQTLVSTEGGKHRRITVRTLPSAPGKLKIYISVTISYQPESGIATAVQNLNRTRTGLAGSLKRLGDRPRTFMTLVGDLPGLPTEDGLRQITETAMEAAGAIRVEGLEDRTVVSLSGFSRLIPGRIGTKGNRINIQVAASPDELRGLTRMTVGTPAISIEY